MSFLIKQAQNLLTHSDTCSGWGGTALLQAGGGSPWGASFTLTDSSTADWHVATQQAITTGQNSGDIYGVAVGFKMTSIASAAVALKCLLAAGGQEYAQFTWNPAQGRTINNLASGSCSILASRISEVMSPWFLVEGIIRRDTSSYSNFIFQIFPAVSSTNGAGAAALFVGNCEFARAQVVRNGPDRWVGPYVATTTAAVSATPDYVDLNVNAYSVGKSYLERKHRSSTGAMTRQVYGTYGMANASDRFVSRTDASKINCWWQNNVALSLQNFDTGQVTSGFLVNKSSPVKGLAEPYSDQYEVSIELEAF